ncbi:MAG: hypothetical protein R2939_06785 [Kofleriaceae bacterium]
MSAMLAIIATMASICSQVPRPPYHAPIASVPAMAATDSSRMSM